MKARILNIGDEVLHGLTINTNASYLAKNLQLLDIEIDQINVVGDDEEKISKEIIDFINSSVEVLITTGGLGPTHDDFTKDVVAKVLGLELVVHKEAKRHLNKYFPNGMASVNNQQVFFPKGSLLLANPLGSALGCYINYQGKHIFLLVGPPTELRPMFENHVEPILQKATKVKKISQEFLLGGIGESELEEKLQNFYQKYPTIKMAPYANLGTIRFVVTALKEDEKIFKEAIHKLQEIFGDNLIGDAKYSIEEHLVETLKKRKYTISTAESCTGGMLASMIVNVSGSSTIFNESIVTYSNDAKIKYLQVNQKTLKQFGAVSNETVIEMATGLRFLTGCDVAIAVSGIAGPGGGAKQKPVGLVHFAININGSIHTESKLFHGDRNMIRRRACVYILWKTISYLNK